MSNQSTAMILSIIVVHSMLTQDTIMPDAGCDPAVV
jgi:hypothetical protein